MKRFRFRLQSVLDYRETEKRERQRELAARNQELAQREDYLQNLLTDHDGTSSTEEISSMAELMQRNGYLEALKGMVVQQRALILEAADAVEKARDAYLEKSVEVEIMEELRVRRELEWKTARKLKERKELDELVTQRHRLTSSVAANGSKKVNSGSGGDHE